MRKVWADPASNEKSPKSNSTYDANPPVPIVEGTIAITKGQLVNGVSIPIGQSQFFQNYVRNLYEQWVIQDGTFVGDGEPIHLPTGISLDFNFPYQQVNGEVALVVLVNDESLEADLNTGPENVDWSRAQSYSWRKIFKLNKDFRYDIPAEAMRRLTMKRTIYARNDWLPFSVNLKALGEPSNVLGPDSSVGGYDSGEILIRVTPRLAVRGFGRRPPPGDSGTIGGTPDSDTAAVHELALNWDRYPIQEAVVPIPTRLSKNSDEAVAVPIVFSLPTYGLVHGVTDDSWPSGMPTKAELDQAHTDGKIAVAFAAYMVLPGSGKFASIRNTTEAVMGQVSNADEVTLAVRDTLGVVEARNYSAGNQAMIGDLQSSEAVGGGWLSGVADWLLPIVEFVAIALKNVGDDHNYTPDHKLSFDKYLNAEITSALQFEASKRDGEAAAAIERLISMLADANAEFGGLGASTGAAISVDYLGTYTGDGNRHLTDAEYVEAEDSVPHELMATFSLIQSQHNPQIMMQAPIMHDRDAQGKRKALPVKSLKLDYDAPLYRSLREEHRYAIPCWWVHRYAPTPLLPTTLVTSFFAWRAHNEPAPIMARSAWPFSSGAENVMALPWRDPATYAAPNPVFRFVGRMVGKFDLDTVTPGAGTSFDWTPFSTAWVGTTSYRRGEFSPLVEGNVGVVELNNISGGNTPDPTGILFSRTFLDGARSDDGTGSVPGSADPVVANYDEPWTNTGFVWQGVIKVQRFPDAFNKSFIGAPLSKRRAGRLPLDEPDEPDRRIPRQPVPPITRQQERNLKTGGGHPIIKPTTAAPRKAKPVAASSSAPAKRKQVTAQRKQTNAKRSSRAPAPKGKGRATRK